MTTTTTIAFIYSVVLDSQNFSLWLLFGDLCTLLAFPLLFFPLFLNFNHFVNILCACVQLHACLRMLVCVHASLW